MPHAKAPRKGPALPRAVDRNRRDCHPHCNLRWPRPRLRRSSRSRHSTRPRRLNVIARITPVAPRIKVAQAHLFLQAELDPNNRIGHFSRDKFSTAPGSLVVEENPATAEHSIAFAVIDCDPVAISLGHSIRAAPVERGRLALGRFADSAIHFTATGLVETDENKQREDRLGRAGNREFKNPRCDSSFFPIREGYLEPRPSVGRIGRDPHGAMKG
jgi:hypothetical protein